MKLWLLVAAFIKLKYKIVGHNFGHYINPILPFHSFTDLMWKIVIIKND